MSSELRGLRREEFRLRSSEQGHPLWPWVRIRGRVRRSRWEQKCVEVCSGGGIGGGRAEVWR